MYEGSPRGEQESFVGLPVLGADFCELISSREPIPGIESLDVYDVGAKSIERHDQIRDFVNLDISLAVPDYHGQPRGDDKFHRDKVLEFKDGLVSGHTLVVGLFTVSEYLASGEHDIDELIAQLPNLNPLFRIDMESLKRAKRVRNGKAHVDKTTDKVRIDHSGDVAFYDTGELFKRIGIFDLVLSEQAYLETHARSHYVGLQNDRCGCNSAPLNRYDCYRIPTDRQADDIAGWSGIGFQHAVAHSLQFFIQTREEHMLEKLDDFNVLRIITDHLNAERTSRTEADDISKNTDPDDQT